jgi:Undecaprenyl-phosphate glucose phosphotransferase
MVTRRFGRFFLPLLKAGDVLTALAAWLAAHVVSSLVHADPAEAVTFNRMLPSLVLALLLLVPVFEQFGLYEPKRMKTVAPELWALVRAILIVWGIIYIITDYFPALEAPPMAKRWALPLWLAAGVGSRFTARELLRWFRRRGWNLRHAAIIGTGGLAQRTFYVLKRNLWMGIEPHYFVGDPAAHAALLGLEVAGPLDHVAETLAARPVDIVFVALSGASRDQADAVLEQLASTSADVRMVPDLPSLHFMKHEVTLVDDLPIITVTHSPLHGWSGMAKRLFDVAFALLALVLMALPMLVIALAIKLTSRGPVFYRQQRAGLADRTFTMIKFRTMIPNAEAVSGPVWTARNDPRVTRLGRALRTTSLDELPQLLNVIRGDMSLVGPRPERPELISRFRRTIPRYMLRHQVKAGLTGLAQVHGLRGPTSLRKRIQYDLYYITNWTFGLDLRILAMTVFGRLINRHER